MKIFVLGDKVLRSQCEEVAVFDDNLKFFEDKMFDTLENADGIGLAAPQVGKLIRLFVVLIPSQNIKKTFVNPIITDYSKDTSPYNEGCLSIPGLEHEVIRPNSVTVYAQDINGKPFHLTADGLFARVIQHEYDHLNGKLYIDHLDDEEKKKMISSFKRNFKSQNNKKKKNSNV